MKLSDLKQEQTTLKEELVAIRDLIDKESRKMNDDESKRVDEITRNLSELDKNIKFEEEAEEAARSLNTIEKPKMENKKTKKGSLELVRELADSGRQTDSVIERNSELGQSIPSMGVFVSRTHYSYQTNGGDFSPTRVKGLNVLEGKPALWEAMGATIYSDLKGGTQKLPFMDAFAGQLVAEEASLTRDQTAPSSVELAPQRVGIQFEVTREGLATFNEGTWNGVLENAYKTIDRKITALIYTTALAGATEVAAGAITKDGFDALEAAVPVDGAFMMTRSTFFEAKSVAIDAGSGKFLASKAGQDMGETEDGTPIFHSGLFADGTNQQYVVYGVPSNIAIGFWGNDSYEVIVDPLTKAGDGVLVVTVSKIVDVKIPNVANAFVKSPDLDAAV